MIKFKNKTQVKLHGSLKQKMIMMIMNNKSLLKGHGLKDINNNLSKAIRKVQKSIKTKKHMSLKKSSTNRFLLMRLTIKPTSTSETKCKCK